MLFLLLEWLRDATGAGWLFDFPFSLLDQVQFRALAAALLAFLLVLIMGRPVINRLVRMKIGDGGSTDAEMLRQHAASKANTPTMGGVLICGAILVCTLLLADLSQYIVILGIVVLVWLSVLGGIDDWLKLTATRRGTGRQGLLAWEKFACQVGLGLLIGYLGYYAGGSREIEHMSHVINLPFQRSYEPGGGGVAPGLWYLSKLGFIMVSVLLIAGLSNAVNITDGMDGLAGGIAGTVSLGLMLLAIIAGAEGLAQYLLVPHVPMSDELAIMAGSMAGACIGFLWWNCMPAKVFMGDTGSLALGGLIAYIAIMTRQEFITLVMCGFFLWEILSVVVQVGYFRMTGGKRVFRCAPYHHHLHLGGWTENQVVVRAWIISILLAVVALATIKIR